MCKIHIIEKEEYIKNCISDLDYDITISNKLVEPSDPDVCIINMSLKENNIVNFISEYINEDTVVIVIADDKDNSSITELIYSGVYWVLDKDLNPDQIRAYLWRAIKISSGVRLLKKAGTLSEEVRDRMRKSLSELDNISRVSEMIA